MTLTLVAWPRDRVDTHPSRDTICPTPEGNSVERGPAKDTDTEEHERHVPWIHNLRIRWLESDMPAPGIRPIYQNPDKTGSGAFDLERCARSL